MRADGRSAEQIREHYLVERELAARLRRSTRAERTELFKTLYDELFERVPAHARLIRRDSPEEGQAAVAARFRLLEPHLRPEQVMVEFAPGDCRLAWRACREVSRVVAIDISDQAGEAVPPANFQLIVYDGYTVPLPDGCADLAFSYQFIEHLHPDDVLDHFRLVYRLLKPGGRYIFSTPHRLTGPHDISRFFAEEPEGFHLREWSHRELVEVAVKAGFSRWYTYRFGRVRESRTINALVLAGEAVGAMLPRGLRRKLLGRALDSVTMAIVR